MKKPPNCKCDKYFAKRGLHEQDCKALEHPKEIGDETVFIGIDTYDKNNNTYVLCRKFNNTTEILLAKTIRDEKAFKKEVDNLAKYFNAIVVKEVNNFK